MDYRKIIKNTPFYSVLKLESFLSHGSRRKIISFLKNLSIVIGILIIFFYSQGNVYFAEKFFGVFLILFSVYMFFFILESFFASFYRNNEAYVIAGEVVYSAKDGDLLRSFLTSNFGIKVVMRAEIEVEKIGSFLDSRATISSFELPSDNFEDFIDIKKLTELIFEQDKDFQVFLSQHGIDKNIFLDIADWVLEDFEREYRRDVWWSRDYLSKIRGIAKDWSFGRPYFLLKYGKEILPQSEKSFFDFDIKEFADEVRGMEAILSRGKDSNIVLVGSPGAGVNDMILEFSRKIMRGKISPELEHKKVYELNWNNLIAFNKDKTGFESEFINLLNEISRSGNIILVIGDISGFILSAESMGSNIGSMMEPYLGNNLQIIATSDQSNFHKKIESNQDIMEHFEKIVVEETDEKKTIKIIEDTVRKIEKRSGLLFSYLAISEIVKGSIQYIPGSVMPDSAIDLLFEMTSSFQGKKTYIVKNDILDFLQIKTKIPLGKMNGGEKDMLLNLEKVLGGRVIGQTEALSAISNAMRRSRANIRNVKRPIGTFLFLGPTGVGKTETAKALSSVFFGDEKYMLRLDMTEYQNTDSLSRLIGSFGSGKPGVLSSMLRDNPYGVLLLDEFEKADKDVLNLFLQILDEGFFSDMDGRKVSLRNVIIIATSNAASDYVFELVKRGENPGEKKDEIISKIVNMGIYKPELINRFDATIIFHPLSNDELKQVAGLMLKKLKNRLAEKGIELVLNDRLFEAVARLGSNQMFGARPMNRFIQDKIEEPIARKIISGEISGGGKIEIKPEELIK